MLGSGGTSLTACAAARRERAKEIVVVSRNGDVNYQHLDAHADADIVVNTTPVGMYPNNGGKLIDLSAFPQCEGVLDVIYNPLRTPLVLDAQMRGIPADGGLAMLVGQAAEAARLFADCKITEERVAAVVEQLEKEFTNIILVGMPGCGKSSVGRKVAELLNRPFLDADLEIEKKYGSVPALIEREGENYFREVESEILTELTKRTGVVIATGGGAVLRTENHLLMRQNGKVFFLERKIDLLETKGRPLSKNLSILYQKRLPCYLACSDVQIQNDEITNAAQQIAQMFS